MLFSNKWPNNNNDNNNNNENGNDVDEAGKVSKVWKVREALYKVIRMYKVSYADDES